jgi:hypothetical protein
MMHGRTQQIEMRKALPARVCRLPRGGWLVDRLRGMDSAHAPESGPGKVRERRCTDAERAERRSTLRRA